MTQVRQSLGIQFYSFLLKLASVCATCNKNNCNTSEPIQILPQYLSSSALVIYLGSFKDPNAHVTSQNKEWRTSTMKSQFLLLLKILNSTIFKGNILPITFECLLLKMCGQEEGYSGSNALYPHLYYGICSLFIN